MIITAPIIYLEDAFYVFGGYENKSERIKTIGRMDKSGNWKKAGELNEGRSGHNVMFDGEFLLVIGGYDYGKSKKKTEKCSLQDSDITCIVQSPTLDSYNFYPELFLVTDSFCKN